MFSSVLHKYRKADDLHENSDHLITAIVKEMMTRVPLLLDAMLCVAVPNSNIIPASIIPSLATCYSILLKLRYNNLSAFHRMVSAITLKGGLNDRGQARLNYLGMTLSCERRLQFQESISLSSENLIIDKLKFNPLIKITGDNLDVYIKASQLFTDKRNKDLHMFASNVIFSRIARMDMDIESPNVDVNSIQAADVLLSSYQQEQLLDVYGVLIGRIMSKLPGMKFLKSHLSLHVPHQYSKKMAEKSTVIPLPILFSNETKHEDCLDIMDSYESQLTSLFTAAFGSLEILRKFKVPVGGDQLTRVRLQEAKNLRTLSVSPEKKFDDLSPIVCEMWHSKQDFLEKCYKALYKVENTPGTLHYFKTILHRNDVNGKVKGRFKPHHELLVAVGEGMIREQILEFCNMECEDDIPQHIKLEGFDKLKDFDKREVLTKLIREFLIFYGYGNVHLGGHIMSENQEIDELQNYCSNLCHWALHLIELDDTAKEGDMSRLLLNCRYSIPFFYSHSALSKYLVENIDFIIKTEYLLSPLQKLRVLEGSFVNVRGGVAQNVESDLVQEHSVCNQKSLIKSLGANKTEKAISRITRAADMISSICDKFDKTVNLKPKGSRHSKCISETDTQIISKSLRKLRPFKFTNGRKCNGFNNIKSLPLSKSKVPMMKDRMNLIIRRLTNGQAVLFDEQEAPEIDEENSSDYLPDI
ncbi:hypothetical protein SNE40_014314 [Patella caerulea]